jgi:hypothetical protein
VVSVKRSSNREPHTHGEDSNHETDARQGEESRQLVQHWPDAGSREILRENIYNYYEFLHTYK